MKTLLLAACVAAASGLSVPRPKFLSTPLARGGGRIVGGTDASPGEFPHQIMLTRGVGGSLMCGGSLISPDTVVTAGHCCDGQTASKLGVSVGSHNLNSEDPEQENFSLTRIKLHEDYDSNTINNDICLLFLDGEADFSSDVIGAIGLPENMEEYEAGTDCVVSGWGTTSAGGSLANVLKKVTVPVVSDADCRDAYGQSDVADSMICAGLDAGGKDSCQGDSGGPFSCGAQLSGVVSWGYGCAEPGYPGVYTQTSYFIDWLMENTDITPPTTTTTTTPAPTTAVPTDSPTTTTTGPTQPPFECPAGWVDANPGCFRLAFNASLNRHDALLHCEALGGFLAEPRTPQQAELLENVAELVYGNLQIKTWWLGLSDQGHEGRWVWEHSVADTDFTNWAEGFPTPDDNLADCAMMHKDMDWAWVDADCGATLSATACQLEAPDATPGPAPTTTTPGEEATTTEGAATTTSGGGVATTTPGGQDTPASERLELVGGSSANEGNVWATNSAGVWGAVCDDGWDSNAADVVCMQLGYSGAAEVFDHSEFGDVGSDDFSYDEISCSGSEGHIQECQHDTEEDCYGGEAAGVRCS